MKVNGIELEGIEVEGQELQGYYDTKSNTYYVNLGLNKYIYHLAIVLGLCLVLIAIIILLQ